MFIQNIVCIVKFNFRKWKKGRSYLRLDGNTSSSEREKLINQFNNPNSNDLWMFLLSTKFVLFINSYITVF